MKEKIFEENLINKHISDFEVIKEQITPEVLKDMMNGQSNEEFWVKEFLAKSFEDDIAFGTKIWTGFNEIVEIAKLRESKEWEDEELIKELSFLSDLTIRSDLPINTELRVAAVLKIKENFEERGFQKKYLTGSNIMKLAYIGEAKAMEMLHLDWRTHKPFTTSLKLNRDNPEVQKILEESKQRKEKSLSDIAAENDPDLEKLFNSFYKGDKPPVQ